jgi:NAD(P)-dependent dehydrogenase (short-subunit alcohol dehydrogenase family)
VITGSSRGIGRAIAERLARDGAALTLTQLEPGPLEETAASLGAAGCEVVATAADLTHAEEVERVVAMALDRFGRVDVLVNNAGFNRRKRRFADIDLESWNEVLAGNLTAAFLTARLVAPGMTERGWGRIVNVGANQALIPLPGNAAYAAAKAGLMGLTRSLAVDLSPHGVVVNAVAPGGPVLDGEVGPDGGVRWPTLLGRPGHVAEVAELVAFLASDACSFTTGQTILCDGGRTMSRLPDAGHGRTLAEILANGDR